MKLWRDKMAGQAKSTKITALFQSFFFVGLCASVAILPVSRLILPTAFAVNPLFGFPLFPTSDFRPLTSVF
jgi:hypothetical protein